MTSWALGPPHLNEEGLLRAAYGVPAGAEAEHLAACAACESAVRALSEQRLRAPAGAEEQLPEAFWQRQRLAILEAAQTAASVAAGYSRLPAALALATLLALALLVVSAPPAPHALPSAPLRAEDEKLLHEISLSVNCVEPRALAPIAILLPDPAGTAGKETKRP